MKNINGNQLCAVETTLKGTDALTGDILQLAIIPLKATLEIDKSKGIFFIDIAPVNTKTEVISGFSASKEDVVTLFDAWFEGLQLKEGKKLMPITYDWAVKRQFLNTIFWESYDDYFSPTIRDITRGAVVLDDVYYYSNNQYKYQKYFLSFVATKSGNECHKNEDILTRASRLPKIYKSLILEMAKLV